MTTRMDEIRARLNAATPGPWRNRGPNALGACEEIAAFGGAVLLGAVMASQDAALIANAPADLAWLLDEVTRLDGERIEAIAQGREMTDMYWDRTRGFDDVQARLIKAEDEVTRLRAGIEAHCWAPRFAPGLNGSPEPHDRALYAMVFDDLEVTP